MVPLLYFLLLVSNVLLSSPIHMIFMARMKYEVFVLAIEITLTVTFMTKTMHSNTIKLLKPYQPQ